MRAMTNRFSSLLAVSAAAGVFFAGTARAEAKDVIDYVIEAIDPTLAPARPLIECLAGGGDALQCAQEVAKEQGKSALPIGAGDDRVKKAVAVFMAVRDERWADVVKIGGEVVAKTVACAIIPVEGPAKGTACSIIGWVIANNASMLDKAYQALKGPDWWALVGLLGTAACDLIPGDGAAGAAKEVLCGPLASVLAGAKQVAEQLSNLAVQGADAVENFIFGDDSHMPYDTYYALSWQPWYHYAVARLLWGNSLTSLAASIYDPCVIYFDSHNQYKSTAQKTCGDMRDKRFLPEVKGFAAAMPVAVSGYFETVVRPAVRVAALVAYGKKTTGEPPGKKLFQNNCAYQMRGRFPFPEPNDEVCKAIARRWVEYPAFKAQFIAAAKQCYADHNLQMPTPTVWATACEAMGPMYVKAFAQESLKLIASIARLRGKHCKEAAEQNGIVFTCQDHAGYSACLTELHPSGWTRCRKAIPVLSRSDQMRGQGKAGSQLAPVPIPKRNWGSASDARRGSAAGQKATGPQVPAPTPTPPPPTRRAGSTGRAAAPVAFEAEALLAAGKVVAGRGQALAQSMSGFGAGWSGGAQILWTARAVGDSLVLTFDLAQPGTYGLEIDLSHAPDYGIVDIQVDGQRSTVRHDGYAPRVTTPVAVPLGRLALGAGPHRITLRIAGRSRSSDGTFAGIDRVRLVR